MHVYVWHHSNHIMHNFSSVATKRMMQFLKDSTFHGFPMIGNSSTLCSKIAWTLFCLCGFAGAIYFAASEIIEYLDQPTATTIVLEDPKEGVKLPPITFCLMYRFSRRRAAQFNITTREQVEYLFASFGPLYTSEDYNMDYFKNSVLSKSDDIAVVDQLLADYCNLSNNTHFKIR